MGGKARHRSDRPAADRDPLHLPDRCALGRDRRRVRNAGRRRLVVLEQMAPACGMDSLSGFRSFHWIVGNARRAGTRHLSFPGDSVSRATFMFGPAGLLVYFIGRAARTKSLEIK